jgi:1-acyl-sn-glycerol-3-phosphate acyltransferase
MVQATIRGAAGRRSSPVPSQPLDLSLGSPYRSVIRLSAYLLFTCFIASLQVVALAVRSRFANLLPIIYHRTCCRLLNIVVERRGTMSTTRPTLFVCNHSSYLDISALGSVIPCSFVAKAEVANWPFFGFLAKLQRTVFVDRRRRTTHQQRDELAKRLDAGDNLILFPEGTSNDGNRTLPFRSALFAVAERKVGGDGDAGAPLTVQPVSLAYTRLNGFPIGRTLRPFFAWYGDMDLFGHLWRVAGLGRIEVVIEFHPPVTIDQFGTRKALAEHCRRAVAGGVAAALTGYRNGPKPAAPEEPPAAPTPEAPPAKQYT